MIKYRWTAPAKPKFLRKTRSWQRYPLTGQSGFNRSSKMSSRSDWIRARTMRIRFLLFFVFLTVQRSAQRINRGGIVTREGRSEDSSNDALSIEDPKGAEELRDSLSQAINSTTSPSTQVTATRQGPCQCGGGVCGCCSRILFDTWKQKACVNVTYDPDEFSFTAKVSMNDRVLYTRTVSGRLVNRLL